MATDDKYARELRRVRLLESLPKGLELHEYLPILNKYCDSTLTVEIFHQAKKEAQSLIDKKEGLL